MPKTEEKHAPRISVLERRLQYPFGEPAKEVQLKDRNVKPRWFNDAAQNGQVYRSKQLGWRDVTLDMVADRDSLGFHTVNAAGQITRGPRGEEVLMWMPEDDWKQIQFAKARVNLDRMKDTNREAQEMINAAGNHLGSEAADFLEEQTKRSVTVRTNREIVHRSTEADDQP
jgi:hypothetical protein